MSRLAAHLRSFGNTLLRMEVTLLVLLIAMTALGRATDLEARIKLALGDAIQGYYVERYIATLDGEDAPPVRERATAALPVRR